MRNTRLDEIKKELSFLSPNHSQRLIDLVIEAIEELQREIISQTDPRLYGDGQ